MRGRKKGREGAKHKRGDSNNDDTRRKISKRQATPKKRDRTDVQTDGSLIVQEGPSHDLTEDSEIIKGKHKKVSKRLKKWGWGVFWNPCIRNLQKGQDIIPAPMTPARKLLCPLRR